MSHPAVPAHLSCASTKSLSGPAHASIVPRTNAVGSGRAACVVAGDTGKAVSCELDASCRDMTAAHETEGDEDDEDPIEKQQRLDDLADRAYRARRTAWWYHQPTAKQMQAHEEWKTKQLQFNPKDW